ncbi:transposase [Streptomyces sp. NPDC093510]|uniref:transposase n=1 Tax=Streptomyces sp. NPDC093510 TaxID=3155199 RepID=UPI0034301B79
MVAFLRDQLRRQIRTGQGRCPWPVTLIVDSQSVKGAETPRELLWRLRVMQPHITQIWADSAYAGQLTAWSDDFLHMTLKTVSRPRGAKGFVVLPRRWKVERTLGWIMKSRRNVRDHERLPQYSEAHLTWALVTFMPRRRTRKGSRTDWSKRPERMDPL